MVAAEHRYPTERFAGRGIVICAGGARLLTCAWVTINVLRRVLDCPLPLELWHIGPRELGRLEAALFQTLGVEVVDALEVCKTWPARRLGGWELKAYALVHSRFDQVLLLDADNVPVVNPEPLFDSPQFAATGTVVWPDVERLTADSLLWDLCRVPFRSEPAWESGQLLIDKSRRWRALQIALHMNMHSDLFYPHTQGDKETFHLAWILAGAGWAMPEYPARRTMTGIYQRDFEGQLLFQHRSAAKWRLGGENRLSSDFCHQAECLRFISELSERWSGRIDALPPGSPEDQEAEKGLIQICWFSLEEAGTDPRLLELLAGNRIGIGASRERLLRWYVRDSVLTFDGAVGILPPLRRQAQRPGTYAVSDGQHAILLLPAPHAGRDSLGITADAVLERFAEDRAISEDDAVTTLATLGQIGDLSTVLQRARSRWQHSDDALRAITRAARRLGYGPPADNFPNRIGYERLP